MTATLVSSTGMPATVRLRPVPVTEPPYEDTNPPGTAPHASNSVGPHDVELPLDWDHHGRMGADPLDSAHHRPPQPRQPLDHPSLAVKRYVDMYVEVLNQRRPVRHLAPHTAEDVYAAIQAGLAYSGLHWLPGHPTPPFLMPHGGYAGARFPQQRHDAQRMAPQRRPHSLPLVRLRRMRCCLPLPGVVEGAAVLSRGTLVRAIAVRLEQQHHRWLCTALDIVG